MAGPLKIARVLVIIFAILTTRLEGIPRATQEDAHNTKDTPARVEPGVAEGWIEKKVLPVYPEKARQMRIQGTVILHVLLDKKGKIKEINVVSGHPLLVPAAMDAVKQWKYKPARVEGRKVEAETDVVINFELEK
jgi:protein TonB